MNRFIHGLGVLMALLSVSLPCQADSVTDKKDVTALVQQLYRESEDSIAYGQFKGKFDPEKGCVLIEKYVHESLIKQEKMRRSGKRTCDMFSRFPGYTLQDDMGGIDAPPKHKLASVSVNGDLAEAMVEMPPNYYPSAIEKKSYLTRVELYLKRFPQGWRIYAFRSYERYVNPERLRVMPKGYGPEDFYRVVDDGGNPPGIDLSEKRESK